MLKRRLKVKQIPLQVVDDPSLHRYASLEEALVSNLVLMADLILAAEDARYAELEDDLSESA